MKNIVKKMVLIIIVIACVCANINIISGFNARIIVEGIVDKNGSVSVDYKYKFIDATALSNDEKYISACSTNLFGLKKKNVYIDVNGNEYDKENMAEYHQNRVAVHSNSLGKDGFVDSEGNKISKFIYDYAFQYENGFAKVMLDNKYGLLDLNGNEVVSCNYDDIEVWTKNLFKVKKDKESYLINSNGDILGRIFSDDVIEFGKINDFNFDKSFRLDEEDVYFSQTRIIVKQDSKYGIFDCNGNKIVDFNYGYFIDITPNIFKENEKEAFVVKEKGNKYLIDKDGNKILNCNDIEIIRYDNDLLTIKNNGKLGVIDVHKNKIIDTEYSSITVFDRYILTYNDGVFKNFDKSGKFLFETKDVTQALGNGEYFISKKYDKFMMVFYGGIMLLVTIIGIISFIHIFPIKNSKKEDK